MKKPSCPVCREATPDMAKRFDPVLGYVCPECFHFLQSADKALRKIGIEGVEHSPVRHTSNPEPETP